jgi:deoxycytidylate deaminase
MKYGYTLLERPSLVDIEGLRAAYEVAQTSDHPRTQVGAVLGPAFGINSKADHRDKYPEQVEWSRVHAEVSAILRCASNGHHARAYTMYAPWASCTNCAACIIKTGIPRVVVHHQLMQLTAPKWQDEVAEGVDLLLRNNVRVEAVSKDFGVTIRFNGEEIKV